MREPVYKSTKSSQKQKSFNHKTSNNVADHFTLMAVPIASGSRFAPVNFNGTRKLIMVCPGTDTDCDNPGCRRGGCQGRLPVLPLFQTVREMPAQPLPAPSAAIVLPGRPDPADLLAA
jgi:hypothetical protein